MKKDPSQEIQTSVLAKDSCCLFWLLHKVCEPQSGGGQLLKLKQNPEIKTEMAKMLEAADFAFFAILDDSCFPSQLQYTAASKDNLQNYNLVTDTPVYVTALQSGINASEV